jgi:hypothetical protein
VGWFETHWYLVMDENTVDQAGSHIGTSAGGLLRRSDPSARYLALPAEGVLHNLIFVRIRKTYPIQACKSPCGRPPMRGLCGMGQMMFHQTHRGSGEGEGGTGFSTREQPTSGGSNGSNWMNDYRLDDLGCPCRESPFMF